jgi:3-hydroxymyristoyl/3-hydroxydecanoyl-(acyl carrier protein) dehydratase
MGEWLRVADEISSGHPALPGHFPDRPIAPGAVLLARLERAAAQLRPGRRVIGVDRGKFIAPLPIGAAFEIELADKGEDALSARVEWRGDLLFSGTLRLAPAAGGSRTP